MIKPRILLLALAGSLTACGGSDLLSHAEGKPAADGLKADLPSAASPSVLLQWSRPSRRQNGEYLEGDDIGGYELRYKELGRDEPKVVNIDDGWIESYEVEPLGGAYDFAIAVYDRDGLYSEFAPLQPK